MHIIWREEKSQWWSRVRKKWEEEGEEVEEDEDKSEEGKI